MVFFDKLTLLTYEDRTFASLNQVEFETNLRKELTDLGIKSDKMMPIHLVPWGENGTGYAALLEPATKNDIAKVKASVDTNSSDDTLLGKAGRCDFRSFRDKDMHMLKKMLTLHVVAGKVTAASLEKELEKERKDLSVTSRTL